MLLAIDVGNTQTHVGMYRGEELVDPGRAQAGRGGSSRAASSSGSVTGRWQAKRSHT